MRILVLAALLGLLTGEAAAKKKKEAPVKRLDRTRVVGAPVLDETAKPGLYVWLEDGWFNVAAVSKSAKKPSMSIRIASTKRIARVRGDFRASHAGKKLTLRARVGEVAVKGRFQTEGDITVKCDEPLFVGPLARRAASTVTIGRY